MDTVTTSNRSGALRDALYVISRAFALPETQRREFLEQQAEQAPQLREELAWMMAALNEEGTGDFLERPASIAPTLPGQAMQAVLPREYKLLRALGEGGMGMVFLAERSDGQHAQRLAVKLLNVAAASIPSMVRRFDAERHILAGLNHPNIAHFIDGGTFADGRPYIALEYVDGVPIDVFCRDRALSVAQRVALMIRVCGAVGHAHQHLVIHRDIKPSNILVSAEGEPKLLDFGIARLIDTGRAEADPATATGMRVMTLAYASPEQLAGAVLTTATDVYSLGMVLYELLASARPWQHTVTSSELVRCIVDVEPQPPSAAARLGPQPLAIPRDLDAIVLRALRKQPEQRYASVQALIDDLHNFLACRPVRARRAQWSYYAYTWLRRHALKLYALLALVAVVVGFSIERNNVLQQRAEVQQRAQNISALFKSALVASDTKVVSKRAVSASDVLDAVRARLDADASIDTATRVDMLLDLGDAYCNYRETPRCLSALNQAWALLPALGPEPLQRARAASLLARAHLENSDPERTEQWLALALRTAQEAFGPDSKEVADIELRYCDFLGGWRADQVERINALTAHAMGVYERLQLLDTPQAKLVLQAAGSALISQRRYAEALQVYGRLLALGGPDSHTPFAMGMRYHIAEMRLLLGQFDQASAELDQVIAAMKISNGERSADLRPSISVAVLSARNRGDWNGALRQAQSLVAVSAADANVNLVARIWDARYLVPTLVWLPGGKTAALDLAQKTAALVAAHPDLAAPEKFIAGIAAVSAKAATGDASAAARAADAMLATAQNLLGNGTLAAELYEADWLAAFAYNGAGRYADSLRLGVVSASAQLRWPRRELDLLQAQARWQLDPSAENRTKFDGAVDAAIGAAQGLCTVPLLVAGTVVKNAAALENAQLRRALAPCAALPAWSDAPASGTDEPSAPKP